MTEETSEVMEQRYAKHPTSLAMTRQQELERAPGSLLYHPRHGTIMCYWSYDLVEKATAVSLPPPRGQDLEESH